MAIANIVELDSYADFLQENPHEIDLLFNELLIGVTSFFRDPPVWDHLAKVVLPSLLNGQGNKSRLRAWVVGCSTGEEAYSLAMIFSEAVSMEGRHKDLSLQIFASDLSREAIDTARRGQYPGSIAAAVSPVRLGRFFNVHAGGYRIKSFIRDMVLFAQQDVVLDPPFTKLDLICCRNLLIYFTPDLQNRLIPMFHYSLEPGGVLLLGTAETIGHYNQLFSTTESRLRFFRRQDNAHSGGVDFLIDSFPPHSKEDPGTSMKEPPPSTENLQMMTDRVLLQFFAPAAVVINKDGDILYISGSTGKYLEPAMGKANWNFHGMVREGLRIPLNTAIKKFRIDRETQRLQGLHVSLPGGGDQIVDITIQALGQSGSANQASLIVFQDIKRPLSEKHGKKDSPVSISAHEAEIQQYRDEIQSLREEARASKEELQSANEELQSTNEELTTSKEEMQSMNEELQTINAEMQSKLDDLSLAQSDLKNLLNSIEIAILFLDQDLNVRRYTDRVTRIINVRESDLGRPFSDLTSSLNYPELHDDALETLRTLTFSEKQIRANDGRWFNVRIMPYRTLENMLDGLVITFVDITKTKELEHELRQGLNS